MLKGTPLVEILAQAASFSPQRMLRIADPPVIHAMTWAASSSKTRATTSCVPLKRCHPQCIHKNNNHHFSGRKGAIALGPGRPGLLTVMLTSFLPLWDEATTAKYWMTFLVFSVLPAPDSPLGRKRKLVRCCLSDASNTGWWEGRKTGLKDHRRKLFSWQKY